MPYLKLNDASLAFGHVPLLDRADFLLDAGERVALIGAMRHGAATINESEAHRVRHLIEAIQACDEQVSAYIEPTHQQIKALIDSISRRS